MVTDAERRRLYDAFVRTWGDEAATTLMELLPPVGWSDLLRQSDLREVRAELKGDLAELRGELIDVKNDVAELRGEVAELRAEVRSQLPKLIAANIASMLGVAGLVAAVLGVAA
jgi:hypothetical protein